MTFDQIIATMKYLGYVTHDENGRMTDLATATARELAGKVLENITLSPTIATEYKRQQEIAKATGISE